MATVPDLADPTKAVDADLTDLPSGHLQRVTPVYWNGTGFVAAPIGGSGGTASAGSPAAVAGTIVSPSYTLFGGQRVALIDSAGAELDYVSPTIVLGPTASARLLSAAASVNATLVKATAGRIFNITGYNANAAARYLKLYSKATAPTVGTDTPVATLYLKPTDIFAFNFPNGMYLPSGIGYGFSTAGADADTGALTAADILAFNVLYS